MNDLYLHISKFRLIRRLLLISIPGLPVSLAIIAITYHVLISNPSSSFVEVAFMTFVLLPFLVLAIGYLVYAGSQVSLCTSTEPRVVFNELGVYSQSLCHDPIPWAELARIRLYVSRDLLNSAILHLTLKHPHLYLPQFSLLERISFTVRSALAKPTFHCGIDLSSTDYDEQQILDLINHYHPSSLPHKVNAHKQHS